MKYEVYPHKIIVEDEEFDTYGIIVTDNQQNKHIFEDITTSYDNIRKMVDFFDTEKPSIKCFKILLEYFMEDL